MAVGQSSSWCAALSWELWLCAGCINGWLYVYLKLLFRTQKIISPNPNFITWIFRVAQIELFLNSLEKTPVIFPLLWEIRYFPSHDVYCICFEIFLIKKKTFWISRSLIGYPTLLLKLRASSGLAVSYWQYTLVLENPNGRRYASFSSWKSN